MLAESTHWYQADSTPRYEATLREARKEHLFPSVTTITGILDKPELIRWKQMQSAKATLEIDRSFYTDDESWMKDVLSKASEVSTDAADLGTHIHHYLESWVKGVALPELRDEVAEQTIKAVKWLEENLVPNTGVAEIPFALDQRGWAGKIDFVGQFVGRGSVMVDFKSQNFKKNVPNIYPSWAYQLMAYNEFANVPIDNIYSLVISTNPEFPIIHVHHWEAVSPKLSIPGLNDAKKIFSHLYETFRLTKQLYYLPTNMEDTNDEGENDL